MDDEISRYLRRIAAQMEGTYFSVHYKLTNKYGKSSIPGDACTTIKVAARQARYWANRGCDVYLAMGAQKDHAGERERFRPPKALRKTFNTVAVRCLYMDIDVDTDPDKDTYRTVGELENGLETFYKATNIPHASLVVQSGRGGKHLYWPFKSLITPEDHGLLSHALVAAAHSVGLKFDSGCTVDVCRLLRIPGTYNFKTGKRLLVKIEQDTPEEYGVDEVREWLDPWWSNVPTISSSRASYAVDSSSDEEDEDWSDTDSLAAGIDKYEPVPAEAMAKECRFFGNAYETGGKGYYEPLWKLHISLCCHTTKPLENAIKVSQGDERYEFTETKTKLEQAQRDRLRSETLGPPSCKAIQDRGAKECTTCIHRDKNTNPISLGFYQPTNDSGVQQRAHGNDLPFGYYRGKDQCIYKDGGNADAREEIIFNYEIVQHSAYLEKGGNNGYKLNFISREGKHDILVSLDDNHLSNRDAMTKALYSQGVFTLHGENARKFLVSYSKMLQEADEKLVDIPAVGWYMRNGETGFAFNRNFITATRSVRCHGLPPEASNYGVMGELSPWTDAAQVVVTDTRPDLSVLVASGFAAPLVALAGQQGFMIGCWSEASGIAKSTAIALAQAIWGSNSGISGLSDTPNHIFAKAATLHSLPIFIDEIKTAPQIDNFQSLIFQITSGKEKGRANRDGTMRASKEWKTLLTYASNSSMAAAAEERQKGSYAPLYRMFEFHGLPNTKLIYSPSDISRMIGLLNTNYGVVGIKYAEYLGKNYVDVMKLIQKVQHKYEQKLQVKQEERFWIAAMSTIMVGAFIAGDLGLAPFDLTTIDSFLVSEFDRMRAGKLVSSVDYSIPSTVIHELFKFLSPLRGRQTIVTDILWTQSGRPIKGAVKILNDSPNLEREHIKVQIAGPETNMSLRFTDAALLEYCLKHSIPKATFAEALRTHLSGRLHPCRIGSGTRYATGTEPCWTFPVIPGSLLEKEVEWANQYFAKTP